MENNIGGARSTVLEKSNGSTTSQKITVIGPVPNQSVEEALISQES